MHSSSSSLDEERYFPGPQKLHNNSIENDKKKPVQKQIRFQIEKKKHSIEIELKKESFHQFFQL